jgi:hypothetical protein
MGGLESDTIGGFNGMLGKQKKEEGEANVTTVLFDDQIEIVHDRFPISVVKPLTDEDYFVRGSTALLDAVGSTVKKIENIQKRLPEEMRAENIIFVITTDGQENASHRYTSSQVKEMIERHKAQDGWEFLFIGANIDAVETAARYGIDKDRAVNYHADGKGTHVLYASVEKAIRTVRASEPLSKDWLEDIDADYQKRGKKKHS